MIAKSGPPFPNNFPNETHETDTVLCFEIKLCSHTREAFPQKVF